MEEGKACGHLADSTRQCHALPNEGSHEKTMLLLAVPSFHLSRQRRQNHSKSDLRQRETHDGAERASRFESVWGPSVDRPLLLMRLQ